MNDRELLELAAKAAGYDCRFSPDDPFCVHEMFIGPKWVAWNPLTDDGDALRLAVKLGLAVAVRDGFTRVWTAESSEGWGDIHHKGDPYAATRRAIVRAAAEIGRAMQ